MNTNDKGMGLYIHIPFCVSKCAYCDFLSFEGTGGDLHERYVQALIAEMRQVLRPHGGPGAPHYGQHSYVDAERCALEGAQADVDAEYRVGAQIDTVYIGGGTPTALPPFLLCEILQEVQRLNLAPNAEVTLEMNPTTNQLAALADYAKQGVNRLSVGLQAWQDEFLRGLRRSHTATEFTQTMQAARDAGIGNINVDLMFGLPWQSMWHWRESITNVLAHSPTHISAYSLTPAEDTPLWDALESRKLTLPSEASDRAMYHEAIRIFSDAGYGHYELSNFALPGMESKHNIDCWRRKPYIGLGLGAHSFDGKKRWRNTKDMGRYLNVWKSFTEEAHRDTWKSPAQETRPDTWESHPQEAHPCIQEDIETLSTQDAMAETMFLGLRMTGGISPQDFYQRFSQPLTQVYGQELEELTSKGLITSTPDKIALTPLGLDLANQVFEAFI